MPKEYKFTNIIGTFTLDEQFGIKSEKLFINSEQTIEIDNASLKKILQSLKNKKYFREFYKNNLVLTKQKIKQAVSDDLFIIQTISNIEEIDKVANTLVKRLREWYSYYLPEFSKSIQSHEKFVELILKKSKNELLKEIRIKKEESMGAELSKDDTKPIMALADQLKDLYQLKEKQKEYLENVMKRVCPNLLAIAGPLIGAKLIQHAGSLKHLVEFPASTVQLLGAEKALFRHMKTGARPPKYGLIYSHQLIAQAKKKEQGKVARGLADKISICVKVDYFKGEPIGDKLRKQLEKKFKK
ncbi:NOP58 family protein [Candidatus Woesearchaeota archaeon]|nr:NOP58 family protein [Candidatus Woesearchaeota archaeon]